MPNVPGMTARKLGDPVTVGVSVESGYPLLHLPFRIRTAPRHPKARKRASVVNHDPAPFGIQIHP